MARLALRVSYDGTEFAGSQVQPGLRTVQGEVERAIEALFGSHEPTVFAGRTDRGVHAAGQIVGCHDRRPELTVETIRRALNAHLPDDVAIVAVERRPDDFHPRYAARWREYRYRIWSGVRAPLARRQVWHRLARLDPAAMNEVARRLIGTRDFASLAGSGEGVPWAVARDHTRGTVRTVYDCRCVEIEPWWTEGGAGGRLFELRVVADGFLPQMVRNMTSAVVEVGRGARHPEWIDDLVAARDRRAAGATAPAHGLTLWRVGYGDWLPDDAGSKQGIDKE